jgi:hypothetical protein
MDGSLTVCNDLTDDLTVKGVANRLDHAVLGADYRKLSTQRLKTDQA